MKLSLLHATRRPERTLMVRQEWLDKAIKPDDVEHIYGVDADDAETIRTVEGVRHVIALPPKGCFRAYNLAAMVSTGDMLIPIEDDLHPDHGWDEMVREAMASHMDEAAMLAVTDGQNQCIEWAVNHKFYEARGLYHEDYWGLFGDTEIRVRSRQDRVLVVLAPHILFLHQQFQPGGIATDPIYERKQAKYLMDEATFNRRMREGWP